MRTAELLSALACFDPGIEIHLSRKTAVVNALYRPGLRGFGETLFEAALDLGHQLIQHPACPEEVLKALHAYDVHTEFIAR